MKAFSFFSYLFGAILGALTGLTFATLGVMACSLTVEAGAGSIDAAVLFTVFMLIAGAVAGLWVAARHTGPPPPPAPPQS